MRCAARRMDMKMVIVLTAIAGALAGVASAAAPATRAMRLASVACRQTNANRKTALTFLEVMMRDGFPAARRYLTGEYIWWTPRHGSVDVATLYPLFQAQVVGAVTMRINGATAECDRVALETESHATLKNGTESQPLPFPVPIP